MARLAGIVHGVVVHIAIAVLSKMPLSPDTHTQRLTAKSVFVFDFRLGKRRFARWRPIDRFHAFENRRSQPFLRKVSVARPHSPWSSDVWMIPLAKNTETLELPPLIVNLFHSILGAHLSNLTTSTFYDRLFCHLKAFSIGSPWVSHPGRYEP